MPVGPMQQRLQPNTLSSRRLKRFAGRLLVEGGVHGPRIVLRVEARSLQASTHSGGGHGAAQLRKDSCTRAVYLRHILLEKAGQLQWARAEGRKSLGR